MLKIFIRNLWCSHSSINKMLGIFQLKPCFRYMLRNNKTSDLLIIHYLIKNQFSFTSYSLSRICLLLLLKVIVVTYVTRLPTKGQRTQLMVNFKKFT
jgi:hypothetical protein